MSLNLGDRAGTAIAALAGNEHWKTLRDELAALVSKQANAALEASHEVAVVANAYARAMRDLWVAFEAASTGVRQGVVEKPRVTRTARNSDKE